MLRPTLMEVGVVVGMFVVVMTIMVFASITLVVVTIKQANVLLSVLESVFETQDLIFGFVGMDNWDIVEPKGIPNCGSR